ncbi:hypothetical protein HMPREF9003_0928 [Bifidobacterium dentium JCVIHMP022]|uniref:Uncharacterized protein n=1 Tax=Bifidobacterium dentium JCVIHMP022 TaxID=553191 RepID=A0AB72YYN4_9BIFI|nr:hypothetical protein HMPREF9003_0928 [Bifidobacterium dentium JCVIHMP022]
MLVEPTESKDNTQSAATQVPGIVNAESINPIQYPLTCYLPTV